MALPRFFDRAADAALPLLGSMERQALADRLERETIRLRADTRVADDEGLRAGFVFAANMLARLYPNVMVEGPEDLAADARELILAINPLIEFDGSPTRTIAFDHEARLDEITVWANGWNAAIDGGGHENGQHAVAIAGMAAATVGVGHLFRAVFSHLLDRGRVGLEPGSFNLVTLGSWSDVIVPDHYDIGSVHLAGCGAIGEAAVSALALMPVAGELVAVDHQCIDAPNLQRYVLATDADEGKPKTSVVSQALENTNLRVTEVREKWGTDERTAPGQRCVLVALDSGRDRIGVQAGLHHRIYNAYTQPLDLGWSRHERFGEDPCLACLYWPTGPQRHHHEDIADAIQQHVLRVRLYLVHRLPAGVPLPPTATLPIVIGQLDDAEMERWRRDPIIRDVAQVFGFTDEQVQEWADRQLDDFYGAICAGAVMRPAHLGREVVVPLAHQSVLAGIMLATQVLIASNADLRAARPSEVEGRYSVLRAMPDSIVAPSSRLTGCLCADQDFVASWRSRWL